MLIELTDQAGDGVDRFLPFSLENCCSIFLNKQKIDVLCKGPAELKR